MTHTDFLLISSFLCFLGVREPPDIMEAKLVFASAIGDIGSLIKIFSSQDVDVNGTNVSSDFNMREGKLCADSLLCV